RLMRLVVLIRERRTDAAVARAEGGEPEAGGPRLRGVLNERLVPRPVGARRADLEGIGVVFDAQRREVELVAIVLGNVERLIMRVGPRNAVDVGQAAGAQLLIEVGRGNGEPIDRLEHRAYAHPGLLPIVYVVILGRDRTGDP